MSSWVTAHTIRCRSSSIRGGQSITVLAIFVSRLATSGADTRTGSESLPKCRSRAEGAVLIIPASSATMPAMKPYSNGQRTRPRCLRTSPRAARRSVPRLPPRTTVSTLLHETIPLIEEQTCANGSQHWSAKRCLSAARRRGRPQKLSEQLGQQFVIENRPGAGGNIGAGVAARAPADGYTLLVGSSTLWVNASLYPRIPYDPVRDFEPIIIGATSPEVAQEGTSAMSHNAILAVISLLAEK